jgi:hypothetical protein
MRCIALAITLMCLTACAGNGNAGGVIVDMQGVDPYQYRMDVEDCETYADQVQVGQKVLVNAAAGAAVGGALGAIFDDGDAAARGAGGGAVIGGAHGASDGINERRRVVRNCLRNRGYAVLN